MSKARISLYIDAGFFWAVSRSPYIESLLLMFVALLFN